MSLPVVAITMGDAAGIGPEVIVKALATRHAYDVCRPLVVGDSGRLVKAAAIAGVAVNVRTVGDPNAAPYERGTIDCLDLGLIPEDLPFGQLSAVARRRVVSVHRAGGRARFRARGGRDLHGSRQQGRAPRRRPRVSWAYGNPRAPDRRD